MEKTALFIIRNKKAGKEDEKILLIILLGSLLKRCQLPY
jgi:hypothetical protein